MDCGLVLETIARVLAAVPIVEDQLVTFDALVGVSEPEHRTEAARMLRDAASSCSDPARRDRLMAAAEAVAAGGPSAFTPEGLSAQQAAAAQSSSPPPPESQDSETKTFSNRRLPLCRSFRSAFFPGPGGARSADLYGQQRPCSCQRKVEMSHSLQSRNVLFPEVADDVRVSLGSSVKRRRAMLASNPIAWKSYAKA
jgi:hypothetical protein